MFLRRAFENKQQESRKNDRVGETNLGCLANLPTIWYHKNALKIKKE